MLAISQFRGKTGNIPFTNLSPILQFLTLTSRMSLDELTFHPESLTGRVRVT